MRAALVEGRQTILIRKGGVAETGGAGEFHLEHPEFWIYPTFLHEGEQGLKIDASEDRHKSPAGTVWMNALARVATATWIAREETLEALEPYHVLTSDTLKKRFYYRRPGLWILTARVWRAAPGFTIPIRPRDAGCKTWITLDQPLPTADLTPALDDPAWSRTTLDLERLLSENE